MSWLDKIIFGLGFRAAQAGSLLPQRSTINFASGAALADNPGADRIDVTVSAGASPDTIVNATTTRTLSAARKQFAIISTGVTVTMPASPQDGDIVSQKFLGAATAAANAGQVLEDGEGGTTSSVALSQGTGVIWRWSASSNRWLIVAVSGTVTFVEAGNNFVTLSAARDQIVKFTDPVDTTGAYLPACAASNNGDLCTVLIKRVVEQNDRFALILPAASSSDLIHYGSTSDILHHDGEVRVYRCDKANSRWLITGSHKYNETAPRVSIVAFGGVADAKMKSDAAMTIGGTTVTSATAAFVAGDVGKSISVRDGTTWYFGTITARISATQVTVSFTASQTFTGADVVWGTDNTAAAQRACNTLKGTGVAVWYPRGAYLFAGNVNVDNIAIEGDGRDKTIIWANFAHTSDPLNAVFRCQAPTPLGSGTISTTPGRTNTLVVTGWTGTAPAAGQIVGPKHGNSFHTYDILAVSGSGPYTLTIDRAIAMPFVATDPVDTYASQPKNITIRNLGFRGRADRYVELACANGVLLEDLGTDTIGGGGPSASNGALSGDTGGRNHTYRRIRIDNRNASNTSTFGVAAESIDGVYGEQIEVIGGDIAVYRPDCNNAVFVQIIGHRCGRGSGTGTAFSFGASGTGLGSTNCSTYGASAIDCAYGVSTGGATGSSESIFSLRALGCDAAININSGAGKVEIEGLNANACKIIGVFAGDCSINGLRAVDLASAPGAVSGIQGYIHQTGGVLRISDGVITSTCTSTSNGSGVYMSAGTIELEDVTLTLADPTTAHGIFAAVSGCKVLMHRNVKISGGLRAIRAVNGAGGYIGPNCDLDSATPTETIFPGTGAWEMGSTGKVSSVTMTTANVVATWTQAFVDVVKVDGTKTANRTLTLPWVKGHIYTIDAKDAPSAFGTVISFGSGTTVTCADGAVSYVYCDGTNARKL